MSNYGTFGENNPVWKAVNRVADMLIVGVLFLVTSIPIVTIGAALCGMYYAAMDSLRKEDGYMFRRYFRGFAKNFKGATIIWLIMLAVGTVICLDIYFWMSHGDTTLNLIMFIFSLILALVWLLTLTFLFPLQTRFENTLGKTFQNAFLLSITHLPMSVSIIVLLGALVMLGLWSPVALIIVLVFGIGVLGFWATYSYERIFKKRGFVDEDEAKIQDDDYEFSVDVDYAQLHAASETADSDAEAAPSDSGSDDADDSADSDSAS